jgi:uncharacterized membrane protein
MHNRPNGAPKLRPITVSDIFESLRAGLADFRAAPVPGLFFANFYVLGGLVMTWITYITGSTILAGPRGHGLSADRRIRGPRAL